MANLTDGPVIVAVKWNGKHKEIHMRASWSGYFRLGDVMLPVKLYPATRTSGPQFVQLHARDHSPVTRVTVCMRDGEELREDDIVRAAEYDGKYIELSRTDIERHTAVERNIAVKQFADATDIPALYYDKPYYLVAAEGGELAYAILRRAFERTGKIAVVTFLFYDRERLGVVSVSEGILMLQTLRFTDEIVPRSDIATPAMPQPSPAQISTAADLMERHTLNFHIEDYRNQQQDSVREIIERKAKGLAPKRQRRIAAETTPADEVTSRMHSMLGGQPDALL